MEECQLSTKLPDTCNCTSGPPILPDPPPFCCGPTTEPPSTTMTTMETTMPPTTNMSTTMTPITTIHTTAPPEPCTSCPYISSCSDNPYLTSECVCTDANRSCECPSGYKKIDTLYSEICWENETRTGVFNHCCKEPPPVEPQAWVIAVSVVVGVLAILVIVCVICCYVKRKLCWAPKQDDENAVQLKRVKTGAIVLEPPRDLPHDPPPDSGAPLPDPETKSPRKNSQSANYSPLANPTLTPVDPPKQLPPDGLSPGGSAKQKKKKKKLKNNKISPEHALPALRSVPPGDQTGSPAGSPAGARTVTPPQNTGSTSNGTNS